MPKNKTRKELYRQFVERAKRENAKFEKASPREKRVIIARDALRHVRAGLLEPTCGDFGDDMPEFAESGELREKIAELAPVCRACARGGLVFAAMMRRNRMRGYEFDGEQYVSEFPVKMFQRLEQAFEGCSMGRGCDETTDDLLAVWENSTRRMNDHGVDHETYRFERIMTWVIEHEGSFNLKQFLKAEIARIPKKYLQNSIILRA